MNFEEAFEYMESASDVCDMTLNRIGMYMESVVAEYQANVMEAGIRVSHEGGTDADYSYLCEAAEDSLGAKFKKVIQSIVDAVAKFCTTVAEKVRALFTGKKNEKTLADAEAMMKSNPKLKNKKVEVPDVKAIEKEHDGVISKLKKKLSQIKSKKDVTEGDASEVERIASDGKKKIAIAAAATVTIAAGAVLAVMKITGKKISLPKLGSKDTVAAASAAEPTKDDSPQKAALKVNIFKHIAFFEKNKTKKQSESISSMFRNWRNSLVSKHGADSFVGKIAKYKSNGKAKSTSPNGLGELEADPNQASYMASRSGEEGSGHIKRGNPDADEAAWAKYMQDRMENESAFDRAIGQLFSESYDSDEYDESVDDMDTYLADLESSLMESSYDFDSDEYSESVDSDIDDILYALDSL